MTVDTSSLAKSLEKKATFESSVRHLETAVKQCDPGALVRDLLPLVSRCHALLKARYSTRGFWLAGRDLYASVLAREIPPKVRDQVQQYWDEAKLFLDPEEEATSEADGIPTLASLLGLPEPHLVRRSHFTDAGPIVHSPPASGPGDDHGAGEQAGQGMESMYSLSGDVLGLLQRLRAQGTGETPGAQQPSPQHLEDLFTQLAILASTLDHEMGHQPHTGPPPASKKVVATLPTVVVTGALIQEWGVGTQCPVCREELEEGDEVKALPCRHVYHNPCLSPWLQHHNSCPVCRFELPTDDPVYEAKKEREKEEEEDRKGAANALSHNEFLYI